MAFCAEFRELDWSHLEHENDVDKKAEMFHETLDRLVSKHFVWKRVRRKSNQSPWLTDSLRASMKKRMAVFRVEGRSPKWRRIDQGIKNL